MAEISGSNDVDDGIDNESGEPLSEFIRDQERQRLDFADEFTRQRDEQPSCEDLLEEQLRVKSRVDHLQRTVARMRRSVVVANVLSAGVAICFALLVLFVAMRPIPDLRIAGVATIEADSVDVPVPEAEPSISTNPVFEITTTVDRKYQLLIRDLYATAKLFRRPDGPVEIRNAMTQDYIEFLADVSRISEQAVEDHASREIMLAIVNLARIGPELREQRYDQQFSLDTLNRMDQIESVVRARDRRTRIDE